LNTVNGPSEADIILNSLAEMRLDKRMQTHAFDKIMSSPTWRPVWARIDDDIRRNFISDFIEVPQTLALHLFRHLYSQPPHNFKSQIPTTSHLTHTITHLTPTSSHLILHISLHSPITSHQTITTAHLRLKW